MKQIAFILYFVVLSFIATTSIPAEEAWTPPEESPFVKVIKNDDGSHSIFYRTPDIKGGMKKEMRDANGVLISVTLYRTGRWGQLVSCKIYDGKNQELYKVSYGYDKRNARLVQERMIDSKTSKLVRVFVYTYDEMGNRSKPIAITYVKDLENPNKKNMTLPSIPEKDPFADKNDKK